MTRFGQHLKSYEGFDLSAFNHYRTGLMSCPQTLNECDRLRADVDTALADGSARQLSNVFEAEWRFSSASIQVFKFDFEKNEMPNA